MVGTAAGVRRGVQAGEAEGECDPVVLSGADAAAAALIRLGDVWEAQGRLAELLRTALIRQDSRDVFATVREQQELLMTCGGHAASAAAALGALGYIMGLSSAASLRDILQALHAAGAVTAAARLRAAAVTAARARAATARVTDMNMALLRQGLAFTSFALRCLTASGNADPGYTASGQHLRLAIFRVVDTIA